MRCKAARCGLLNEAIPCNFTCNSCNVQSNSCIFFRRAILPLFCPLRTADSQHALGPQPIRINAREDPSSLLEAMCPGATNMWSIMERPCSCNDLNCCYALSRENEWQRNVYLLANHPLIRVWNIIWCSTVVDLSIECIENMSASARLLLSTKLLILDLTAV